MSSETSRCASCSDACWAACRTSLVTFKLCPRGPTASTRSPDCKGVGERLSGVTSGGVVSLGTAGPETGSEAGAAATPGGDPAPSP